MARRGRSNLANEHFFFVTTTVVQWAQVFTKDKYCEILLDNIKHYQQRFKFTILGYVIMPSHFHWIVEVHPELGTISDIMRDIKKYSAWDLMEALATDRRPELSRLFVTQANGTSQSRKFWMSRFDDEVIRNQRMFWTKLRYIHNNPVEAGLVQRPEDYKYSSARNYVLQDHSILFVDTTLANP
jgi:REP element-mobilizing transposase RayT